MRKPLLYNSLLERRQNIQGILHLFSDSQQREKSPASQFAFLRKDEDFRNLLDFYNTEHHNKNMLVVDDGGNELFILKQLNVKLKQFDILYVTVYADYLKPSCAIINHVDKYLATLGFYRSEALMTCEKWGEAIYESK